MQFSLFELDKSRFNVHWKHACELCPSFEKVGIKSDIYGPEAFTPDHKPIMGEDPKCVGKKFTIIFYLFLQTRLQFMVEWGNNNASHCLFFDFWRLLFSEYLQSKRIRVFLFSQNTYSNGELTIRC